MYYTELWPNWTNYSCKMIWTYLEMSFEGFRMIRSEVGLQEAEIKNFENFISKVLGFQGLDLYLRIRILTWTRVSKSIP